MRVKLVIGVMGTVHHPGATYAYVDCSPYYFVEDKIDMCQLRKEAMTMTRSCNCLSENCNTVHLETS